MIFSRKPDEDKDSTGSVTEGCCHILLTNSLHTKYFPCFVRVTETGLKSGTTRNIVGIRANGQYFLGHFLFFLFSSSVLDFLVGHSPITSACAGAVVLSHLRTFAQKC